MVATDREGQFKILPFAPRVAEQEQQLAATTTTDMTARRDL